MHPRSLLLGLALCAAACAAQEEALPSGSGPPLQIDVLRTARYLEIFVWEPQRPCSCEDDLNRWPELGECIGPFFDLISPGCSRDPPPGSCVEEISLTRADGSAVGVSPDRRDPPRPYWRRYSLETADELMLHPQGCGGEAEVTVPPASVEPLEFSPATLGDDHLPVYHLAPSTADALMWARAFGLSTSSSASTSS